MKKFSLVSLFLLLSSIVISYSCSNELEDVGSTSAEGRMVTVTTRSATAAEIEYPITLYAFRNYDGRLVTSVTANSSSDFQMLLPEGGYKIVAMAGTSGLTLPTNPSLTTDIGVPDDGLIDSPLQIGRADVSVSNTVSEVEINMTYQVSQVNLTLTDIPENITSVSVSFSSMYESLTFNGTLSGSKTITMDLVNKNDGTWYAPVAYMLPGQTTQLTLSISMKDATTTMTYGYTHTTNLKAGTPYNLVGSYKGEFIVSGTITSVGWAPTESIDFKFGPGAEEDNTGSGDTGGSDDNGGAGNEGEGDEGANSDGIYMVDEIPQVKKLWNNHLVVNSKENNDGTYDLLLMSLEEWSKPLGQFSIDELNGYIEDDLVNWHIPSDVELIQLVTNIAPSYASVNTTIKDKGKPITIAEYYLCDNLNKIVLMSNNSIGSIKATTPTNTTDPYRLRLVKTVKVQLKSAGAQ